MIDILLIDDHQIIFQGVEALLSAQTEIGKLDYAGSIAAATQQLQQAHYDLIILDLNIHGQNSLDAIDDFRQHQQQIKIIIFSSYNNQTLVKRAKQHDINGYLLKNVQPQQFIQTIKQVMTGEQSFNLQDMELNPLQSATTEYYQLDTLSKRERQVASLIVNGSNEQEIVDNLYISKHTVRTHKKNIFRKLGVSGTIGLLKYIQANREVF